MLDQIINLVKEKAGDIINNNPNIPADKKEEAVSVTGASVAGGLQDVVSRGGVNDVMNLFAEKSDVSSNPAAQHVSSSFIENMVSKIGLSKDQAGSLGASVIPAVLGSLVTKTNDPNDKSFDIQDIFNQLSGGKTSGVNMGSILSKFKTGLDSDKDGDVDLQDLKSMFGGSGGMMDKIKGMLK